MNKLAMVIHSMHEEQKVISDACLEPLEKEAILMVNSLLQLTNGNVEKYLMEESDATNWLALPFQNNSQSV